MVNDMYISKVYSLKVCMILWEWMRDINSCCESDKVNWFRWKHNGGDIPSMVVDCPCCHYREQTDKRFGRRKDRRTACFTGCLLSGYAWELGCMEFSSPYHSFDNACGTPENAQKIVDACKEALEDLGVKCE